MNIALIIQIITAVLLVVSVLFQASSGGLGSALGGSSSYHTKRGVEKGIFYLTIILAVIFTGVSVIVLTM